MKWELNEIKVGDAVRVNMGAYYHYGVCTAEDRIVQFGLPQINLNADEVEVCATDIATFLCGKFAEVMVLSKKELKNANSVKKIVELAESRIGEKGYNILHNNCEHFVNSCVFNAHNSNQVADIQKQMFELINPKYIFIAPVEMFSNNEIIPKHTAKEIKKITNQSLIKQKCAAYGLLKYAVEQTFHIQEDFKQLTKTKTGKPISNDYCLSISHTNELVAVAVSKCNVGVDLEVINPKQSMDLLKNSMLSSEENIETNTPGDVYSIWTKKEAIFKFKDGKCFNPKQVKINELNTKTIEFDYNNSAYVLSIASENISNVKINQIFQ